MNSLFSLVPPPLLIVFAISGIALIYATVRLVKSIWSPKKLHVGANIKLSKNTLKILAELGQDPTWMNPEQWKAVDTLESRSKSHWMVRIIYLVGTIFFVVGFLSGIHGLYLLLSGGCLLFIAQAYQRNLFEEQFRSATPSRNNQKTRFTNPSWVKWFAGLLILLGVLSGYHLYMLTVSFGRPLTGVEYYRKHTGLDQLPLPATQWINSPQGQKLTQSFYDIDSGWMGRGYSVVSNLLGLCAFLVGLAILKRSAATPNIARLFATSKLFLNLVYFIPSMVFLISLVKYSASIGAIPLWAVAAYIAGLPIFIVAEYLVSNILYIMLLIYMNRRNVKEHFSIHLI